MENKITNRLISELLAAPYNPRQIGEEDFAALVESIKRFGFVVPVVFNTRTGWLVSGHQRVKAAAQLGMTEVPTLEIDIDEDQEKLLNVAMNRIRGKFDAEKLSTIFEELIGAGEEVEITGFDALEVAEINAMLGSTPVDNPTFLQLVVRLSKKDAVEVKEALRAAKKAGLTEYETENQNSNGNALTRIAEQFLKT
jgi:ParB-like chromosome segregation protein Spo0J